MVSQFGDNARLAVEGAVSNHSTLPIIHIEHRREAEINSRGPQLGSQVKTGRFGKMPGGRRMLIPDNAQLAHGGQSGEPFTKALDPPPS
jgi:hypothetical protein